VRPLDYFLPAYEFSERHSLAIDAPAGRIDQAFREVSIADIPVARALWWLRRLGRPYGDSTKPFIGGELPGGRAGERRERPKPQHEQHNAQEGQQEGHRANTAPPLPGPPAAAQQHPGPGDSAPPPAPHTPGGGRGGRRPQKGGGGKHQCRHKKKGQPQKKKT